MAITKNKNAQHRFDKDTFVTIKRDNKAGNNIAYPKKQEHGAYI
jgi:hypothetical protein